MINKNFNKNLIIGTQIFLASIISMSVIAFATQAGSAEDPLVSKSYVDEEIKKAIANISVNLDDSVLDNNANSVVANTFVPVLVEANKTLFGKEGSEIILRSGNCIAVIPEGVSEIANITTGSDISNNQSLEINNLLIISRDDGRGIKANVDSWFLVKGDYIIN